MSDDLYPGLTSQQAEILLKQNGLNTIRPENFTRLKKLLHNIFSPITFMLIAAALLSFITHKAFDGYFILVLLSINIIITFWQENKADNAVKKLNQHLTSQVTVFRDNAWKKIDSKLLVVGDIVKLILGDVIAADGKILVAKNVTVNQSAITGESLPQEKKTGDVLYSGAFLVTGLIIMQVTATGKNTYFGKTIFNSKSSRKKSLLEQDILRVSKFLSLFSIIAIILLTTIFIIQKAPLTDILTIDLTLLIAGIPITLPTVMTLIIELGVVDMAKKQVIIRRLSSLEDLSNVNFLLTDKTGTLTRNEINIQKIISYRDFKQEDVLRFAYLTSVNDSESEINQSIIKKANVDKIKIGNYKIRDYVPVDLTRKRSSAVVDYESQVMHLTVGAPQEIEKLCQLSNKQREIFNQDIEDLAKHGFRAIAVAVSKKAGIEKDMQLVGILSLADALRPESKEVADYLLQNGIGLAMVTGDNQAITEEIVQELGLKGRVFTRTELKKLGWDKINQDVFRNVSAFAEILPDDKLKLVQHAKKYFTVASNGDGINDLPAVKEANVGFAVKNAVDALKSTADIVLLSNGISVIKDSIIEGRKIFERIYTYSIYRISESLRLIVTIVVLGFLYKVYPLTPLQLILLALLNDSSTISLAFDRVKLTTRPAKINVKQRFTQSSLYGLAGIANSLILFFLMTSVFHLNWNLVQTIFFLKLNVSGLMLIYVVHTKERWWRFLPGWEIVLATGITQLLATLIVFTGFFMPARVPITWIIFVWVWSFFWMQISELFKFVQPKIS